MLTRATRSGSKALALQIAKKTNLADASAVGIPDIEDAISQSHNDSSMTLDELETPISPSKKRKAPSPKKANTKLVRKKVGVQYSQSPPPNWEEVYGEIRAMRVNINAPVDTMGCEQLGKTESDPKVRHSFARCRPHPDYFTERKVRNVGWTHVILPD